MHGAENNFHHPETTTLTFKGNPYQSVDVEVTFEPVGTTFRLGQGDLIYLRLPTSAIADTEIVVWPNGIGVWVPYPGDYVILDAAGEELDRL